MSKTKAKPTKSDAEVQTPRFFFPTEGVSIEAATKEEAIEILNKRKKEQEVGDDES